MRPAGSQGVVASFMPYHICTTARGQNRTNERVSMMFQIRWVETEVGCQFVDPILGFLPSVHRVTHDARWCSWPSRRSSRAKLAWRDEPANCSFLGKNRRQAG